MLTLTDSPAAPVASTRRGCASCHAPIPYTVGRPCTECDACTPAPRLAQRLYMRVWRTKRRAKALGIRV